MKRIFSFLAQFCLGLFILTYSGGYTALADNLFDLQGHLFYLEDREQAWNIQDVAAEPLAGQFQTVEGAKLNFGFSSSAYWVRLNLPQHMHVGQHHHVLEVGVSTLDDIRIYQRGLNQDWQEARGGDLLPFSMRKIPHHLMAVYLPPRADRFETLYIRVQSASSLQIQPRLYSEEGFRQQISQEKYIYGFFQGLIGVLMLYNLFLYLAMGQRSSLYFVGYLLAFFLTVLSFYGLTQQYLWPDWPELQQVTHLFWPILILLFAALFSREFLQTMKNLPNFDRYLKNYALVLMGLGTTFWLFPYQVSAMLIALAGLAFVGLLSCLIYLARQSRIHGIGYFALSWGFFMAGFAFVLLGLLGLIPSNWHIEFSVQVGVILQVLILAGALVEQIKQMSLEQEETKLAFAAAEEAHQSQAQFFSLISHEIRTPMNSILGFSQLLEEITKDPQALEYLSMIRRNGDNLHSLVGDILDLSKLEAGKFSILPELSDIGVICTELAAEMKVKLDRAVVMSLELPENLFSTFWIDGFRLRQILQNLLTNAAKFTEQGFIRLKVQCRPAGEDACDLWIEVQDSGVGIPSAEAGKIFYPFIQREGQKAEKYGGTGLGLTISKYLVEAMGGSIKVWSEQGHGATFSIRFPRVLHDQPADLEEK